MNSPPDPVKYARDYFITNCVGFFGYTILVWDHIITFDDEIKFIWQGGRRGFLFYLFLLNRYFTPLSFIGNLTAYLGNWSMQHCEKFVRYEGSCTIIALELSSLILLLRVRALYRHKPWVWYSVTALLVVETGLFAWLMTHAIPVPQPTDSPYRACTMIFDPKLDWVPSLSAWFPLVYDTIVILLTLARCIGPLKHKTPGNTFRTLVKDGALYYSVLFCVNATLALMIVFTSPDIKNITAQLEQLLTVAMISRITLNLKKEARFVPEEVTTFADNGSLHQTITYGHTNGHSRGLSQGISRRSEITFSSNAAPIRDLELGAICDLEEVEEDDEEQSSLWPRHCASTNGRSDGFDTSCSDSFKLSTPQSSHSPRYSRLSHHRYSQSQSYHNSPLNRNQGQRHRRSLTTSPSSGLPSSPHFPWPMTPDNVHVMDIETFDNANNDDAHESYEMNEIDGGSGIIGEVKTESAEWRKTPES